MAKVSVTDFQELIDEPIATVFTLPKYDDCLAVIAKANACRDTLKDLLFNYDDPCAMESDSEGEEQGQGQRGRQAVFGTEDTLLQMKAVDSLLAEVADIPAIVPLEQVVKWLQHVLVWMSQAPEVVFQRMQTGRGSPSEQGGIMDYMDCVALVTSADAEAFSHISDDLAVLLRELDILVPGDEGDDVLSPSLHPIVLYSKRVLAFLKREQLKCEEYMRRVSFFIDADHSGDAAEAVQWLQEMIVQWSLSVVTPTTALLADMEATLEDLQRGGQPSRKRVPEVKAVTPRTKKRRASRDLTVVEPPSESESDEDHNSSAAPSQKRPKSAKTARSGKAAKRVSSGEGSSPKLSRKPSSERHDPTPLSDSNSLTYVGGYKNSSGDKCLNSARPENPCMWPRRRDSDYCSEECASTASTVMLQALLEYR